MGGLLYLDHQIRSIHFATTSTKLLIWFIAQIATLLAWGLMSKNTYVQRTQGAPIWWVSYRARCTTPQCCNVQWMASCSRHTL